MSAVYLHTNRSNGKVYVGQTQREPWMRWRDQRNEAVRGESKSRYLQAAIRKYGWAGFDHQILSTASNQAELDNLEKVWIILLRATDRDFGYNLASGGAKGAPSEETRQRMSEAAKKRKRGPCSAETKAKIAAAQTGISKPATSAVLAAAKIRATSEDFRQKISQAKIGIPWSSARRSAHKPRLAWNKGLKMETPAWNKGIKMPSVSAKMMGNMNGRRREVSHV